MHISVREKKLIKCISVVKSQLVLNKFHFCIFMLNEYGSVMEIHMLAIEGLQSEPVVVDTDDVDDLFG